MVFGEYCNSFDTGQDLFTAYKKQDNEHLLTISNLCCNPYIIAIAINATISEINVVQKIRGSGIVAIVNSSLLIDLPL